MAALDGTYRPNRFTIAQDGNAYLNGAAFLNDAGTDIAPELEQLAGLSADLTKLAAITATAAEINAVADAMPHTVTVSSPVESPAGTVTITITAKDTSGATYAGVTPVLVFYATTNTGATLGTALASLNAAATSGEIIDSATGNVFWCKTDAAGALVISIPGGTSGDDGDFLIAIGANGVVVPSTVITYAP